MSAQLWTILQKWRDAINLHGKRRFLGHFTSADAAAEAYAAASTQLHGEFGRIA